MLPDWQLPPGTDRGLWDYVSSDRVAREYDEALAGSPLLGLDIRFCERHFTKPGRLVDLGCGTGRLVLHFACRGFECLGVDLSSTMLEVARSKAEREGLKIQWLQANLVELDVIASNSLDYAACLFSTLGMIRGIDNRRQFLRHVRRIVKPGGTFVVHAHNARFRLGIGLGKRGAESGDRTMPQHRGGAELTIHHFTRNELTEELAAAGFGIRELEPVGIRPGGKLRWPWLLRSVRSYGFLVATR